MSTDNIVYRKLAKGKLRRYSKCATFKNSYAICTTTRGTHFNSGENVYVVKVWGESIYILKLNEDGTPIPNTVYIDNKKYYLY